MLALNNQHYILQTPTAMTKVLIARTSWPIVTLNPASVPIVTMSTL